MKLHRVRALWESRLAAPPVPSLVCHCETSARATVHASILGERPFTATGRPGRSLRPSTIRRCTSGHLLPRGWPWLVAVLLFALSCFHYYTAGFWPAARRLSIAAFTLPSCSGLIFSRLSGARESSARPSTFTPAGATEASASWTGALSIAAALASLYVPWVFHDLQFRVGNPRSARLDHGHADDRRRAGGDPAAALGRPLSIIAIVLMIYAPAGPVAARHPRASRQHLEERGQPPLPHEQRASMASRWASSPRTCFTTCLFGVLATRVGLGRFFIDIATAHWPGAFAGGPAKVSIFASGLFGMISGSSIANTVTVGSLDHPDDDPHRLSAPLRRRGGIDRAATGGQITPPIMGAAAFLMVEYLAMPYQTIIIAAIVAGMSCISSACSAKCTSKAKKRGMRGMTAAELPQDQATSCGAIG